jgi:hypothetical protein
VLIFKFNPHLSLTLRQCHALADTEFASTNLIYQRLLWLTLMVLNSLADLYDPLTMPPDLVRAHQDLGKFVDTCYRPQPFDTEMQRIEFHFDLYKKYTQPLFGSQKKRRN